MLCCIVLLIIAILVIAFAPIWSTLSLALWRILSAARTFHITLSVCCQLHLQLPLLITLPAYLFGEYLFVFWLIWPLQNPFLFLLFSFFFQRYYVAPILCMALPFSFFLSPFFLLYSLFLESVLNNTLSLSLSLFFFFLNIFLSWWKFQYLYWWVYGDPFD